VPSSGSRCNPKLCKCPYALKFLLNPSLNYAVAITPDQIDDAHLAYHYKITNYPAGVYYELTTGAQGFPSDQSALCLRGGRGAAHFWCAAHHILRYVWVGADSSATDESRASGRVQPIMQCDGKSLPLGLPPCRSVGDIMQAMAWYVVRMQLHRCGAVRWS
jgi:hypothetical protein